MVTTRGLIGLRPAPARAAAVTAPPYDVIKPGSALEALLSKNPDSLFHVTLGADPKGALDALVARGVLERDDEPSFYVYEQSWGGETRTGLFVAAEVTPYEAKRIIRHEKVFDDKVQGRIALAKTTGHTMEPVFVLTRSKLAPLFERAKREAPLYTIESDFGGVNDLHGLRSRVFRVPEESELGRAFVEALASDPFYIADGHHRYHAALKGGQTHFLAYVTNEAKIQAYDRVVRGRKRFSEIAGALPLEAAPFSTPPKHHYAIYTKQGSWIAPFAERRDDVVGRLDCSALEREIYPRLGLGHADIKDPAHFDYYPESQLDQMTAVVDRGDYDAAIALHPVSLDELFAVANAGLADASIVMPEKSTFFAPKILSGLFVYRHATRDS
jgi:uncharacterized protein (DUF1015 family)